MSATPAYLLILIGAAILLVLALCAAVRLFSLEHVDLRANIGKLANFSFTAKSHPREERPTKRPPKGKGQPLDRA